MLTFTPYTTALPFMGPMESWLGAEDAQRLAAYAIYEGMFRNVPESFKLVQRGNEQNPLYLPSARTIVEATNRYLAKGWGYAIDPTMGTPEERASLGLQLEKLFRREKVRSKFATQKRFGLVRGDAVWHIVADPEKAEGTRLSVYEVDPGAYFPIYDPWDTNKLLGVHLVVPVVMADGKTIIKRQTYRKTESGAISYELSWWQTGAWDDRDDSITLKPAEKIPEGDANTPTSFEFDSQITAIPVYHVQNNRDGGEFGTSELAGLESIIAGINQSMSDEDLALSLEGLGLYATNSSPPTDPETKEEVNWRLGPGWVVEIDPDSTFERVNGINSVDPYQTHMAALRASAHEAQGVPDIAVGKVDVQTAESGIALAFQMAPMLAKNAEKEEEILSVTDHMLYDITTMWLPVYESFSVAARPVSSVGDPMPTNRKAVLDEIMVMLTAEPPLISAEYARTLISEKLGYDFPDEIAQAAVDEAAAYAAARNVDPFASRVAAELDETTPQ